MYNNIDRQLQFIYESLENINLQLNDTSTRSQYYDPYRYNRYNRYNQNSYDSTYNYSNRPYPDYYENTTANYNNRTTSNRYVQREPDTHEFHVRLSEPVTLNELSSPGYLSNLFSNLGRSSQEEASEDTSLKLINNNTELLVHTEDQPVYCSICREDINTTENNNIKRKITHCGHVFHQKCLDKWFENRKTCPICRHRLGTSNNNTATDVNSLD